MVKDNDTVYLGKGDYSSYGKTNVKNKSLTLTFIGAGADKTKWYIGSPTPDMQKEGTEYNGDYSFEGNEKITFEGIGFSVYPSNFKGFIRIKNIVVNNCKISGLSTYWGYKTTKFSYTTFDCPNSEYALWYYTGNEMTFDHCKFNGSGKFVNAYRTEFESIIDSNVKYGDSAENPIVINYNDYIA